MFNGIIAIDVAPRIADFLTRVSAFSKKPAMIVNTGDEALFRQEKLDYVDAVLVSIHQPVSESLLKHLDQLRYIGVLGTSVKKIPLAFCEARGIKVTNVTDYCDHDTAEWVILRMLEFFRSRSKARSALGRSLGVIGVGAVGKLVAKLGMALGMDVYFNAMSSHDDLVSQGAHKTTKEEIFKSCEVVSAHMPAFQSWLNTDILEGAKGDLCFINTCMGRICVGGDLERILTKRNDISLIMDKIAGDNYPELKGRALIFPEPAFLTIDAENRLIEKFLRNVANGAMAKK